MKLGSTVFLRGVFVFVGLVVLALCIGSLPLVINGDAGKYSLILTGVYLTAIPFFIAVRQTIKLLGHIDHGEAFSKLSVNALKKIKNCALTISGMYGVGLPFIYMRAKQDDAPGIFALGLVIVAASFVVATIAAVLQGLLENAADMKSENDLTV